MTDFQDHFEDMDEEIGEFSEDFSERLEELFGFEFEVQQVRQETARDQYYIQLDPVGAAEELSDELDANVQTAGTIGFYIDT